MSKRICNDHRSGDREGTTTGEGGRGETRSFPRIDPSAGEDDGSGGGGGYSGSTTTGGGMPITKEDYENILNNKKKKTQGGGSSRGSVSPNKNVMMTK